MNEKKFDSKGGIYAKARPAYPKEVFDYLRSHGLTDRQKIVADIGSGTGIFTTQISDYAKTVYAVEPNNDMRSIAEETFKGCPNIISVQATAENTGLPASSVDFITVAQAFHWFDRFSFKRECQRILKPDGKIVLLWNDRDSENDTVKENFAVNKLYCPNFKGSSNGIDFSKEGFSDFFDGAFDTIEFINEMQYDKTAFIERNLSSSYAPLKYDTQYNAYISALEAVFDRHQTNGTVLYPYITRCYMGKISGQP